MLVKWLCSRCKAETVDAVEIQEAQQRLRLAHVTHTGWQHVVTLPFTVKKHEQLQHWHMWHIALSHVSLLLQRWTRPGVLRVCRYARVKESQDMVLSTRTPNHTAAAQWKLCDHIHWHH
jgi:hypothetical protein